MKRKLTQLVSLLFVCILAFGITFSVSALKVSGDMNGDNECNLQDVLFVIDALINKKDVPSADISGDGKISLVDVFKMFKLAASPKLESESSSADIAVANGTVTENVTISGESISATVPAGVAVNDGTTSLTLSVTEMAASDGNITAGDGATAKSYDVHIEGVAKTNEKVIIVNLGKTLSEGFNQGNIALYHVEDGATVAMTQVLTLSELDTHNEFYYDPATGDISVALAKFSEIAIVSDEEAKWEGNYDFTWYDANATELTIANADQLAAFGAIVGGMATTEAFSGLKTFDGNDVSISGLDSNGIAQDYFEGKTVTLLSDIDLNDAEAANNPNLIFYPIGYNSDDGKYEKTGVAVTTGYYAFMGTFDGNGNTISNIYQNTWEMKGDHDWYDASLQYSRDGMGLFGKVNGGTVKNLIVKNFSSDGEIATTGVIAAYADSADGKPATFENISIFNCNPRVYNIGNGGIVGCAGWYSRNKTLETDGYKNAVTFRNITVDQTNKISALWGSWGVSCGGILGQYYPDSGCGIKFENCHVAAQIDVNNDVCSNYQYYWYRYAGMLMGTIRRNTTDKDGYTVADTTGVTATGCTYTMGDWNEYWYCEIVKNSLASYTHDHQFSRLDKITTVSEIQDASGNWNKEGNFVIPNADNTAAECYHIFKNSEGELYRHFHNVPDESNPDIYETFDLNGDGELNDLKEDRQCYFIPFNQLFTGLDMGVKAAYEFEGVEFKEDGPVKSEKKFEALGTITTYTPDKAITLGELFESTVDDSELSKASIFAAVSPASDGATVSATYALDLNDWKNSTLTFAEGSTGTAKIVITDYFYCTPTVIYLNEKTAEPVEKFDVVMNNGDFLHRVGNNGTVALDKLFKAKDGVTVGTVSVTVEAVDGTGASGEYSNNAIQFSNTGVVKVTITDDLYCIPTELYLEVVDAVNATTATSATANNVVLLNNAGLSSLAVSGDYTFYGNGFTLTYTGNGQYLNNGLKQGVVTVSENGMLDNVRIKATIYPKAYMYYGYSAVGDYVQGGPKADSTDGQNRYYYQLSAVVAKGNATISNCYIYGGRNNIFIDTGDVTVKDTILECGVVANVQVQSNASHTITFENVTTIQHQVNPTIGDTSLVMLGAGVLVGPETNDNPTIVLNGNFKQYNWVTAEDKAAVSGDAAKMIIQAALDATAFNHTINGKTASNLSLVYMNDYEAKISNNTGLPYALEAITMNGINGQAYSLKGATGSQIYSDYKNADKTTVNGYYQPQFKFKDDLGGQRIPDEGGDEFCYVESELNKVVNVMFPSGDTKELDLAAMVDITKYTGQNLGRVIACKDENGNAVAVTDGKVSLSVAGEYTVTYTVTDTLFYDKDGKAINESKTYSWDVTVSVSLKDTAVPDARFEFDATKQKMGYYKKSSIFSTDIYQYIPFLAGLNIYDYNGKTEYLRFNGDTDFSKVAKIEVTNKYSGNDALIRVTLTDGGIIELQLLARADSSGGATYTGSIKTSGNTIYFVNDGTTSESDKTTTAAYWYVDFYKFTGNNGVAIQSGQQTFNSTGSSASTPSGNFSTTIKYTVTYDANEGNCGQTTGYATSVSAAVTLPTPTRSGYIFAGWYTAASGGTRVGGAGDSYTPSANITLYAQWGKPCTVTYDANGGSCGTASEKYTGTALTLPTPTRDGYWFIGWYDAAEGGNKIGDAGATYNPKGEITLYAHWQEKIEYTVTYNANGGSCGTASATYAGTALTLPTPTRTGYKFLGWYTATSGGTKIGDAGATYTPSANITLYAQWEDLPTYTITIKNQSNATVTVDKTSTYEGDTVSVTVSFSQSNNKTLTVKDASGNTVLSKTAAGTYTFTMPASNVTIAASSEKSCVTPDTLVMLADGTQKRIDEVTYSDNLLVWDFFNGEYASVPASIIFVHEYEANSILSLKFEDGTIVKTIEGHGFFDVAANDFVIIDEDNVESYIGHGFVKVNGAGYTTVKLVDYSIHTELTEVYSIQTAKYINFMVEGMLSITPPPFDGWFDYFEIGEGMKYDEAKMQLDIAKYGLYEYEDFAEYVTYEQFIAFNGPYLKVLVGRNVLTYEQILELIATYVNP